MGLLPRTGLYPAYAHALSTQRRYGLARVCRVWEIARSTVYVQARATTPPPPLRKPGPRPPRSDEARLAQIRTVLAASPFLGEGHRKVWARLRWQDKCWPASKLRSRP